MCTFHHLTETDTHMTVEYEFANFDSTYISGFIPSMVAKTYNLHSWQTAPHSQLECMNANGKFLLAEQANGKKAPCD